MIHGKHVLILNAEGDCLVSPDFNGDMQPVDGRNGSESILLLERCKNVDDFEKVVLRFVKKYGVDENYSEEQLEDGEFLKLKNVVAADFTYNQETKGREYLERWFVDFLYVLNLSGSDVETKIRGEDGKDAGWTFRNNTLTVLKFGGLYMTIGCIAETLADYEEHVRKEVCEMSNLEARRILSEFNDWRRGVGAYEFNEDPAKNADCPYSPKEIGKAIDVAVAALRKDLGNE